MISVVEGIESNTESLAASIHHFAIGKRQRSRGAINRHSITAFAVLHHLCTLWYNNNRFDEGNRDDGKVANCWLRTEPGQTNLIVYWLIAKCRHSSGFVFAFSIIIIIIIVIVIIINSLESHQSHKLPCLPTAATIVIRQHCTIEIFFFLSQCLVNRIVKIFFNFIFSSSSYYSS